ncbi:hypothetical protein SLS55_006792 [Diplodia seriata]|uniref:Uncharacterized protein n=1 Tax=Diplodia seriata TaxID=420778 RepID=A0ABR3CAS9_9PEZI
MSSIGIGGYAPVYLQEDLDDNTFTFRDPSNGLNLDFMTYSMYCIAKRNPETLLDPSIMEEHVKKTFSTFFQYYVRNNLSMMTGGSVYQAINTSLPIETSPVNDSLTSNGTAAVPRPISSTNRTAIAEVSTRVELLKMNVAAVWLSTSILVWLIATTIIVAALQRRYLKNLDRNIECIGDVLVLVAGSDKLLDLAQKMEPKDLKYQKQTQTRLGWFEDSRGTRRWGIEVVDEE